MATAHWGSPLAVLPIASLETDSFLLPVHNQLRNCGLAASTRPRLAAGYLLQVGTLGSGAFSTVVRARDRQTGEEVAVKLIKRGSLVRVAGLGWTVCWQPG